MRHVPYSGLLEPALYLGILVFNLTLTFWIGEPLLGLVGIMIFIPIVVLFLVHLFDPRRRATDADLAAHRREQFGNVVPTLVSVGRQSA